MAGRPEEKYEPGELTRVKQNLGALSPEEAKKMSKILGGEIGIEHTDSHVNERYQELYNQIKNKRKDKWIGQTQTFNNIPVEENFNSAIRYSYLEKIKLYLLASHPDHSIKTTKQTIRAVFDLLLTQKNYINTIFFENSNYYFYKSISTLVKSTRFISKSIQKKYIRREENPFYWSIVDTISNWDIESIQEEIINLKSQPHHVTLDLCLPLIKLIYTPLIRLSKLNLKNDIEGAITYLYKLSIAELFKKDLQIDRLRKSYIMAIGETANVFKIIKYRLYPLLLMFVSPKAYDYNTMFKLKGHEILNFLNLKTEDFITGFEKDNSRHAVSPSVEKELPDDETIENAGIIDITIQQGIYLLDRMFPGSGWTILSENPDMYPYFKIILNLPNDAALISPEDPLQRIVILIAMLKDLFYGFSNMDYGYFRDANEKAIDLKEEMDLLIKNWYLFIDELILKNYLGSLHEYCRHLERSTDLSETEYTHRIASDILWTKKTYICPNISIRLPKMVQHRAKTAIPKLYKSVEQLKNILEKIVREIFSSGQIAVETLRNPEAESWFEIENHVSLRLKSLLKEEKKNLTNGELILSAFKIVSILDNIIKTSGQGEEEWGISRLFRSEESRGFKPIYSVNAKNTFFKLKDKNPANDIDPEEETEAYDMLTGFLGQKQFTVYLNNFIVNYKDVNDVFSVMCINIHGFYTDPDRDPVKLIKNTGKSITESIRLLKDIPFRTGRDNIYIIIPESNTELARETAERILSKAQSVNRLYIGICEYHPGMDKEQILTYLENTISKQLPTPGITYYDGNTGKYIQAAI